MMKKNLFVFIAMLMAGNVFGLSVNLSNNDVNRDDEINISDLNTLIDAIMNDPFNMNYDVNNDGVVNIADVYTMIDLILENTDTSTDETIVVNGVAFKMIHVDGGTFKMGATAEQGSDADSSESPVHQVTLSDFSIGETEVTQALWLAVMGSNPSYFAPRNGYTEDLSRPVEVVTWNDCQTFISKLNEITGMHFRLPTEAEWEFAARGGNKSKGYKYAGSNRLDEVAWYWGNIPSQTSRTPGYGTQPVRTKKANELGLYDMSGNVWEWCRDKYGDYSSAAQTNPTGPTSGSLRVRRGGGWGYSAKDCRVSTRYYDVQVSGATSGLGLRLAL